MAHQPIPPPHHHVILWTGVIGFAVLIGSFWVMGLGGLFHGAPSRARALDDTARAWERVRADADATIARITAGTPRNEKKQDAATAAAIIEMVKNRLPDADTAATTTVTTSTPTTNE